MKLRAHPLLRRIDPPVATAFGCILLLLLVGSYAQARYLADSRRATMTDTVAAWRDYPPRFFPLPHPSWRNTAWLKKNPWFARKLLPDLRRRVHAVLA